jgi:hypothetical protein
VTGVHSLSGRLIFSKSPQGKNHTVAKELRHNNWIRSVIKITSPAHFAQYIEVWDTLQTTALVPKRPDSISWQLSTYGTYSAKSAYNAQFFGRFDAKKIWAAHAEPECKLFG